MIIDELVYNRTPADAARVAALSAKGWAAMTADERAEWSAGMKGAYNAADLNRVETACKFIADYFNGLQAVLDSYRATLGVASDSLWNVPFTYPIDISVKTDWAVSDIPTAEALARYLLNVDKVSDVILIEKQLPESMEYLIWSGANEIERALAEEYGRGTEYEEETKEKISDTAQAWFFSGDLYSGEI